MSSVTRPRGPLPARIYWTRRLLVAGVALGMVFGVNQLLGSEPPTDSGPSAVPAAATPATDPAGATVTAAPTTPAAATGPEQRGESRGDKNKRRKAEKTKAPLAEPSGICTNSDVAITPKVKGDAYAGEGVMLTLELSTIESPACHWEVSPESVAVRVTSGSDRIWSSQDCPAAIETQPVVVRKDHTTSVQVFWHGQRSDEECSRITSWAMPGYYHVTAAPLGGEPSDHQFRLVLPPTPTITPEPRPTKKSEKAEAEAADQGRQRQDKQRSERD